jgi:hypothetical protein
MVRERSARNPTGERRGEENSSSMVEFIFVTATRVGH